MQREGVEPGMLSEVYRALLADFTKKPDPAKKQKPVAPPRQLVPSEQKKILTLDEQITALIEERNAAAHYARQYAEKARAAQRQITALLENKEDVLAKGTRT